MNARRSPLLSIALILVILCAQFAFPSRVDAACSGVVFVDADSAAVSPTGCSWALAFPKLQDALKLGTLASGDQIWVAAGTYYPDEGGGQVNNDRYSTFTLVEGVKVYGGFAGTESMLSQRNSNPATNGTVLSGDIDATVGNANNSYHVVNANTLTSATVLDGFTITGGNTAGDGFFGGGVHVVNASPVFANLIITDNTSPTGGGGGMFISTDPGEVVSAPSLTDVTISNNTAERGGGLFNQNSDPTLTRVIFSGNTATNGAGGGVNSQTQTETDPPSNPVLIDVTFSNNHATGGGGMVNSNSHATYIRVTFSGNTATRRGGGLLNEKSNPELTNVTFYGNTSSESVGAAPWGGGGMMNDNSNPTLNHVTFSGNNSLTLAGDAMRNEGTSSPQIRNSIFWGDNNDEIAGGGSGTTTVVDSVIQGGFTGTNIVTTNPSLSALANNGGFTQTMAIGEGSSALDVGGLNFACASTDQRGTSRPQGGGCDMGAYEWVPSYTVTANVVGNGTVGKNPNQATYAPGAEVTLTATPALGWSFAGWSGDLTGMTNPATVTLNSSKTVTATFTQDHYTLTINVVGSGTVGKNPDQATYVYGDVVTLTATPANGWSFAGWTGDLTGATNPTTITMNGNRTVTAYFSQTVRFLGADFNGDGKTDVAVFRPSNSTWYIQGVGPFVYGTTGDIPVPADYNGDGKDDIAVFRPSNSTWYIYGVGPFVYGTVGDIPVVADYNGDGKDDIAVFRPSNSTWYIYGVGPFVYGTLGDIPVVADYNGDGKDDIAVFRPSNSTWYIYGVGPFVYGTVGDIPVVSDYDGDGKADIAVFRPSNSTWYLYGIGPRVYGTVGDLPVVGDYNGDGKADIAVFRPSNSTWYIYGVGPSMFGTVGDIPV